MEAPGYDEIWEEVLRFFGPFGNPPGLYTNGRRLRKGRPSATPPLDVMVAFWWRLKTAQVLCPDGEREAVRTMKYYRENSSFLMWGPYQVGLLSWARGVQGVPLNMELDVPRNFEMDFFCQMLDRKVTVNWERGEEETHQEFYSMIQRIVAERGVCLTR